MFKVRRNSSENIFKSSENDDKECLFINKYCLQKCYCERDIEKNIIKYCIDDQVYEWELNVYNYLLNKKLTTNMTILDNKIIYNTFDKISLYNYLLKNTWYTKIILNEVFSFVKKFNKYNFLHGNLHLHNIFVNPDTFLSKGRFYVIDFSNSFIFKTNRNGVTSCPEYHRTSFIGEYDKKVNDEFFIYWDFFTLYVSLKMFLKNDRENLVYLENLIQNYMSQELVEKYLRYLC